MPGKNKTRMVGWHPSDPALVEWLDAEVARLGGGRGTQSAILDEALTEYRAACMADPLTDSDLRRIAEARELAVAQGISPGLPKEQDPGSTT